MDNQKTGAFIARMRKEKDLTQAALGEKLGVSNRTVSKWENGDGLPDVSILPQLADALDITVDELLRGERAERPVPEVKVTEVADRKNLYNIYRILFTISLFCAIFAALLGTLNEVYCTWAFSTLFYTHWEILFAVTSLGASVVSGLLYATGVTRLSLTYDEDEIYRLTHNRTWLLILVLTPFPLSFIYRVCILFMPDIWTAVVVLLIAVILFLVYQRSTRRDRDEA